MPFRASALVRCLVLVMLVARGLTFGVRFAAFFSSLFVCSKPLLVAQLGALLLVGIPTSTVNDALVPVVHSDLGLLRCLTLYLRQQSGTQHASSRPVVACAQQGREEVYAALQYAASFTAW